MRNERRLTEVHKALVGTPEGDGAHVRAHRTKVAARDGNTGKKGHFMTVWRKVVETNGPPEPPSIVVETRMKALIRVLLSLRTEVHPKNHYLRGCKSRAIYQAGDCTYNAHDDRGSLVQDGCPVCWSSVVWMRFTYSPMAAMAQKKAS